MHKIQWKKKKNTPCNETCDRREKNIATTKVIVIPKTLFSVNYYKVLKFKEPCLIGDVTERRVGSNHCEYNETKLN